MTRPLNCSFPFTDCFEDEESVLQRDVDPSLANIKTIPLDDINARGGLDSFFPLDNNEDDVFMVNELFELDQGVAMESSEHHLHSMSCFDDNFHDFTSFYNPLPSSSFASCYSMPQPSLSPAILSSPASQDPNTLPSSPVPECTSSIDITRPENDLEYMCGFLPIKTDPNVLKKPLPNRTEKQEVPGLTNELMSAPLDSFNIHTGPNMLPLSFLNTQPQNTTIPIGHCITQLATNSDGWNANIRNSSNSRGSSQTDRQHSPSPSPTCPVRSPDSTSSVFTDYPESEYGKDAASPDVPTSIPGLNKLDIVEMPFYEFKKIVENGSIPERDKEEVKAIRKRGKNKMAAKTCRQRKLEVLNELQRDVDRLKGTKARLALKALSLQREIEAYKMKCNIRQNDNSHRLLPAVVH